MLQYTRVLSIVFGLVVIVCPAASGAEKKDPAKTPKAVHMEATVVSVSGIAQKRLATDPEGKWEPIRAGDALGELTIIRTGLGAKVVLNFSDRGRLIVKSATKLGVGTLRKQGRLLKARVGLKYGSMHTTVETARGPNDFQVATPVATLSVRGTRGRIAFWGDFGLRLCGKKGTWEVATDRRKKNVHHGECTDGQLTPHVTLAGRRRDTKMGDPHGGLSKGETENLRKYGDGRGIFSFSGSGTNGLHASGLSSLPENGRDDGDYQY